MKIIIDRFEGGYAVCEDMNTRVISDFPVESLPEGASAGDILVYDGNSFIIDHEETEARRERINKLFKDLWG